MESVSVEHARGLESLIRSLRDETEARRGLPESLVDKIKEARFCRASLPEDLGGLGLPRVEALQMLEVLGGFEASVPWIAWNNSLVCYFSRFMTPEDRAQMFADPNWLYAQSTRPCGRAAVGTDGYRVSGRWDLVSGCELAEWLMLLCLEEEGGAPRMMETGDPFTRFVFVRKGDFEIVDTWHTGGLRGTGSHDVIVKDVFVPKAHTISLGDPVTLDHPLGVVPVVCNTIAEFAAQTLGVAQAAVDAVVEQGKTSVTPGPLPDLRDRPAAQAAVTSRAAALRASRAHLHDCVGRMWDRAVEGHIATLEEIGEVYGAAAIAVEASVTTVDQMYAIAGTRALYESSPLERAHRDIHAMMRHVAAQSLWVEDAGRVTFGLEPQGPLYAI